MFLFCDLFESQLAKWKKTLETIPEEGISRISVPENIVHCSSVESDFIPKFPESPDRQPGAVQHACMLCPFLVQQARGATDDLHYPLF